MRIKTLKKKIKILESAFAKSAGVYYSANLTRNTIIGEVHETVDGEEYDFHTVTGVPEGATFSEVINYWKDTLDESEKEAYEQFFDLDNIIARYKNGEKHIMHSYKTKNILGGFMMATEHIEMYEDDVTGDLLAIVYIIDETEKYKTNEKLDEEIKYSDVLSREFISVYHINLYKNTSTLLKYNDTENRGKVILQRERRANVYTERIGAYCEKYVVEPEKEDFSKKLSIENLKAELSEKPRWVYRFQSDSNETGYSYFELEATRISEGDFDGNIIMTFRPIDDIIQAETKEKLELYERLEEEKNQNEVLQALGNNYYAIFRIDLENDTYLKIRCTPEAESLYGGTDSAKRELATLCLNVIEPEYYEIMRKFFNLNTLAERLDGKDFLEEECETIGGEWHRSRFITKRRDENGRATHVLYATQVINKEKEYERKLKRIAEEAEYANRAKSEFISQIAHDIRTPMNSMLGFLFLAQNSLGNDEKVSYALERMQIASEFLKDLVNDVLDVAKMESGKMKLDLKKISLLKVLKEMPVLVDAERIKKNLRFDYNLHDISHDVIIADPLRLKQIYTNVLANAVKYTPDGGKIDFEIYQEVIDEKKLRLVAVIEDTGIGMSEEFMEKMFNKFERETDTRVNKITGYGLGLSIVKQLVEMMNGECIVTSEPGCGTRFKIEIEAEYADGLGKAEEKKDYSEICRGMHILVAEDNALSREVVRELLKMHDIEASTAHDGMECVNILENSEAGEFDAVLMDMQMPNMNGIEAAKAIRQTKREDYLNIPIIAMTANAQESEIEMCLNAGMNVHLAKPVNMNKLLEVLAKNKK